MVKIKSDQCMQIKYVEQIRSASKAFYLFLPVYGRESIDFAQNFLNGVIDGFTYFTVSCITKSQLLWLISVCVSDINRTQKHIIVETLNLVIYRYIKTFFFYTKIFKMQFAAFFLLVACTTKSKICNAIFFKKRSFSRKSTLM